MSKARTLANLISDNAELADGQISVAEVVGAAPTASPTFTGNIDAGDNVKIRLGDSDDLQIYHDGSSNRSYITESNTHSNGHLFIQGDNLILENAGGGNYFRAINGGAVQLYHAGAEKLATTSTGIDITGAGTFSSNVSLTGTLNVDSSTTNGFLSAGSNILNFGTTSNDTLAFYANNTNHMKLKPDGEVIINETGNAEGDLRVESDSNSHMLFVDAGTNRVGINKSAPNRAFHVGGESEFDGTIFIDKADGTAVQVIGTSNNTGYLNWESNGWTFYTNGPVEALRLGSSEMVVNEDSRDYDFRVETNGADYAFFVDGGTNNIGIQSGTSWSLSGGGSASSGSGVSIDMGYDGTIYAGSAYWAGGLKTGTGFFSDASGDRYKRASRQVTQINQSSQGGDIQFRSQTSGSAGAVISWHEMADFGRNEVVFNDGGLDQNFRVESDNNSSMLFVDAENDKIGINTGSPDAMLTVDTNIGGSSTGTLARFHASKGESDSTFFQIAATRHGTAQRVQLQAFDDDGSTGRTLALNSSGGSVGIGSNDTNGLVTIAGSGSGNYNQLTLTNNYTANTNKVTGMTTLNYQNDSTSVFQAYHTNGSNNLYLGSADSSQRGFRNIHTFIAPSSTGTTGHRKITSHNYTSFIVNDDSNDIDFRVEGNNVANGIVYDADDETVCFFTNSTSSSVPSGINFKRDGANNSWQNIGHTTAAGDGYSYIQFLYNSSRIGQAVQSGTTGVTYQTTSDYRLKENAVAITSATERVKQLNPIRFNFISEPDRTIDGFLAHEVQAIVPEAVSGTKDEVDSNGRPEYQGLDTSRLVPVLVATIKELEARITALENA
jgi:hypothetical protein